MPPLFLPFLAVVAVITATPGPDTVLVVRNTLNGGRRDGLLTAFGCSTGLLVWGAASSVGLAAVFRASPVLFPLIRMAGGVYLMWLGIRMIGNPWSGDDGLRSDHGASANPNRGNQPFVEGLLTDLFNPKALAFFTALLPQFLAPNDRVLTTTLLFAAIAAVAALAGLCAYACVAAQARVLLGRPVVRRLLDRVTGGVLLALGVRMLTREAL